MTSWPVFTLDKMIEVGLVQLGRGKVISKRDIAANPGPYPIYSSAKDGDGKFGEYGDYLFDEELITWSVDGGGRLFHRPNHRFSVTNVGGFLRIKDTTRVDYRYLWYALTLEHSRTAFDWIKKAHPSVIRKEYNNIPLPPLPEQQRIVGVLDQAFDGITKAKANAKQNLTNAKELFESELEEVFSLQDATWGEATLSEVCKEFGRGKSRHRPRNDPSLYGGDYPFIQTGDVRNSGDWITGYSQTYNEKGLAQSKLWPRGTLCITIAANIAEIGILDFDACFPDSIIGCVVNDEKTSNEYLCYVLRYYQAHLKAQGKGSAQDNINIATFENQKFPFPALPVQAEIVEKLNSICSAIEVYEMNRQAAISYIADLGQSILHQAFSGYL